MHCKSYIHLTSSLIDVFDQSSQYLKKAFEFLDEAFTLIDAVKLKLMDSQEKSHEHYLNFNHMH